MIRQLRKDKKMSTYAGKYTFETEDPKPKMWPTVVTSVMLLLALIPGVGFINVLLAIPVGFALLMSFMSYRTKLGRVYLGFLLLAASVVLPFIITLGILAVA